MNIENECKNCYHEQGNKYCCIDCYTMSNRSSAFAPKEELIRQDYKSQLIHDFRKYIDIVIKDYNSTCGKPDEYEYGMRKGLEMAIKYIIKYDYKETKW